MLTVRDILQLPILSSGKVVAGTRGLSRVVEHVSVMEVDLTKWCSPTLVRGAALEISSMYSLADSEERQIQAVQHLNRTGGSGLLLCYVGKVLKEISPELIRVCDEMDFPLITMPGLVGYKEIIREVSDALLGLDNKRLQDAIDVYEYVTKLLIDGKDNTALVLALEHMIGKRVLYFDQNVQPIVTSGYSASQLQEITGYIDRYSTEFLLRHSSKSVYFDELGTSIYLCPIYNKTYYFGILAIVGDNFSDLDKVSIAQIRNALSISTLNQISVLQQQEKRRSDFIRDIITGHYTEEDILRRSTSIECNIAKVDGCIVLDIRDFKHLAQRNKENALLSLKNRFFERVRDELSTLAGDSICCSFSAVHSRSVREPAHHAGGADAAAGAEGAAGSGRVHRRGLPLQGHWQHKGELRNGAAGAAHRRLLAGRCSLRGQRKLSGVYDPAEALSGGAAADPQGGKRPAGSGARVRSGAQQRAGDHLALSAAKRHGLQGRGRPAVSAQEHRAAAQAEDHVALSGGSLCPPRQKAV